MKSFTAIVSLAAFFSAAAAAQMCNQTPPAANANNKNVQPIATPNSATAQACQQQCTANSQCQSFVFGLPPTGSTPTCKLFAVAASAVPNQGTNLNVFDKACTSVPTGAPSHTKPQGQ